MKKLLLFFAISVTGIVLFFGILNQFNKSAAKKSLEKTDFEIKFDTQMEHSNLPPPYDFRRERVAATEVELDWDLPELNIILPNKVKKQYGTISGFRIFRDGAWYKDVGQLNTKFTDSGLTPYQEYTYEIATLSFDNKIQGKKSKKLIVQTKPGDIKPITSTTNKINTYLALGSQLRADTEKDTTTSWQTKVSEKLRQEYSTQNIIDKSQAGIKTNELAKNIQRDIEEANPDSVTINVGVDDLVGSSREIGYIGLYQYKTDLEKIIDATQPSPERLVLLINLSSVEDKKINERYKAWNKAIQDIAINKEIPLVDIAILMEQSADQKLNHDIVNLTQYGHDIIADEVYKTIKENTKK
jgi:lysophospholipase L1-like esterase